MFPRQMNKIFFITAKIMKTDDIRRTIFGAALAALQRTQLWHSELRKHIPLGIEGDMFT